MFGAQGAYDQVDNEQRPPHEMTHELLAGAAGFEAMDDPSIVELVAQMEKYTKSACHAAWLGRPELRIPSGPVCPESPADAGTATMIAKDFPLI